MLPIALLVIASIVLVLALLAFWQSVRALFGHGVDEISAAIGGDRAALVDEKNSLLTALKDLEFERAVGKVSEVDWRRLDASYRARAKAVLAELDKDLGPWREKAEKLVRERLGQRGVGKKAAARASKASADSRGSQAAQGEAKEPQTAPSAKPAEGAPSAKPAEGAPSAKLAEGAPSAKPAEGAPSAKPAEAAPSAKPADTGPLLKDALVADEGGVRVRVTCPSCATLNEPDAVFCKKCATRLAASVAEETS